MKNYSNEDERFLISQIVARDSEALGALYDRYNSLVFSLAKNITDNYEAAEDITLDVFTQVWEKAGTYRPEKAPVKSWITSITRNRSIDVLRRNKSRPNFHSPLWADFSPDSLPADESNPVEALEQAQIRRKIHEALATLPTEQKDALALAYFKGYTHRQIAESLNEPLGTIKTRIRLALQKLCKIFSGKKILE
ncbi:RNA polymerase sigma-70 factor [Olavius sp. associated proteobacterium Delta 1]|nr:RNA polymerase sigma-70 factor [Olavius sp. associated proteobacterium Delta 1]